MAFTVGSWNTMRGLGDAERAPQIIEGVKRLDTDVVVLSEAYAIGTVLGQEATGMADQEAFESFVQDAGYMVLHAAYEDQTPRDYEQHLVVLSRLGMMTVTRLATRNAITLAFDDPETGTMVRGYGQHAEDRSAFIREMISNALVQDARRFRRGDLLPTTFVAGDLNEMYANTARARMLGSPFVNAAVRSSGWLAAKAGADKGVGKKIARLHSLGSRLHDMTEGQPLSRLEEAGFRDADPKHRPTMKAAGVPVAQLDHILVNEGLRVEKFDILPGKGSDHKAISARIRVTD